MIAGFSPYTDVLEMEADVNPRGLLSSLHIPDLVWYLVLKGQGSCSFTTSWLEPRALLHHLKLYYMS